MKNRSNFLSLDISTCSLAPQTCAFHCNTVITMMYQSLCCFLLHNVVLRIEILGFGHGLELQVVAGRVLKEHRVLLPWLSLKPQVWLNDEFYSMLFQSFSQIIELFHRQCKTSMRHWHFVAIDWVVEVLTSILVSYPMADDLVPMQRVVLPL